MDVDHDEPVTETAQDEVRRVARYGGKTEAAVSGNGASRSGGQRKRRKQKRRHAEAAAKQKRRQAESGACGSAWAEAVWAEAVWVKVGRKGVG